MHPRVKKTIWLLVKVVVFVALLDYARRHAQLDDEIAVLVASPDPAAREAVGARLRVERKPSAEDASYGVRTSEGRRFAVPLADVETDSTPRSATLRYALLPGLRTLVASLRWGHLAAAFAVFGPALFLMAVRWHVLMTASAIQVPFFTLVRLHYLGFFYNAFMPGGAGGDILKAVYLAQHCAQKTEAATVVLVDRIVGVVGLLMVAGAVVLFSGGQASGLAAQIGALALALVAFAALYFSAAVRRAVRYEAWVARLPRADLFLRIDAALYGLRYQKKSLALALGLTLVLQLLEIVGVSWAGDALGLRDARFTHYLVFVPIGFLVNAIPVSFGGIGLMEGAYLKLFHDAGVATATQGFMLGVLTRLIVLGWSALGAASALFPPRARELPTASQVGA